MMHESEECDDGTDANSGNSDERADACRTDCIEASCGDGWLDTAEGCDDGDNDPGDGCGTDCLVEDGWDCTGSPSVCTPGIPDAPGETCEAATPILLSSGSLTDTYGVSNDYEPGDVTTGASCTTYSTSEGAEVVYTVTLNPGETLTATLTNSELDVVLYLLDTCPPGANSCIAGADNAVGNPETLVYPGPDESPITTEETFYLVVDAHCHVRPCPTPSDTYQLDWSIE
jgi:cysteine-rich repeat protein